MAVLDVKDWHVLIVDDEVDNLTVLEVLFDFYDAHVTTARSGEQALNLLYNHVYRLVLLDLQMPKVSGWDLVKRVRENPNRAVRTMPLIAVTAMAMPGDKERVLASGFDGYISKPIDAGMFMQAVQTILEQTAMQHTTPSVTVETPEIVPASAPLAAPPITGAPQIAPETVTQAVPQTKPLTPLESDTPDPLSTSNTLDTGPKIQSKTEKAT